MNLNELLCSGYLLFTYLIDLLQTLLTQPFFLFFRTIRQQTFLSLQSLKTLQLHSNPWVCDCKLKSFRDYVVDNKLYNRPTSCFEPARLTKKHWDAISTRDFACKPHILVHPEYVFSSPGKNATLGCLVVSKISINIVHIIIRVTFKIECQEFYHSI